MSCAFADAHAVEGTVDEEEGDDEEGRRENVRQAAALRGGQLHGELNGQQAKEWREFNDRIEGDGRRILKRIAHYVADDCSVVEGRALLLEFDFNDFLGVVPGTAGVGHEDGLVQAEDGDGEEIADEEKRFDEGEGQRGEEHRDENVEHALLRVLGANLDDLFTVSDAGGRSSVELDVGLDEFDGAVSAGGHGLRARAGEPVNHGAASDEAEDKRRMEERKIIDVFG